MFLNFWICTSVLMVVIGTSTWLYIYFSFYLANQSKISISTVHVFFQIHMSTLSKSWNKAIINSLPKVQVQFVIKSAFNKVLFNVHITLFFEHSKISPNTINLVHNLLLTAHDIFWCIWKNTAMNLDHRVKSAAITILSSPIALVLFFIFYLALVVLIWLFMNQ